MNVEAYLRAAAASREERLRWWREARFGMFIHWGLYSQLGRNEWAMNRERIPRAEYEPLADTWHPAERPAREWARLAAEAGMRYAVLTAKHHEGFCLWDTAQTDYNAVRRGPGRDLVGEFVEACREHGLKVGLYYSLMDWRHPDGVRCATDDAARRRFLDFTQGCVRELCTQYGPIDILWYDCHWPLRTPVQWESAEMNAMVRALQPGILINNRSMLNEDFGTPEEHVTPAAEGRAWEACMTLNGSWGYMPSAIDWRSVREILAMLRTAAAGGGNLLLNIGPRPDGSVPDEAVERLRTVGRWLGRYGDAVYGPLDRVAGRMEWMLTGQWTLRGNTAYYWVDRWPGTTLAIGGLQTPVRRATLLPNGTELIVEQSDRRLVLRGLPETSPDDIAGVAVIRLECDGPPRQVLGSGYETL